MQASAQVLDINHEKKEIDDFVYSDLTLQRYQSHQSIAMKMAV